MRDPDRIRRILQKVLDVWEAHPDLRLGQLIGNCRTHPYGDAYALEDDVLERRLAEIYAPPAKGAA